MAIREFRQDAGAAASQIDQGAIEGVLSLQRGDSDGEVVLIYHHSGLQDPVRIRALAENISEYPRDNCFMFFTDSDTVHPAVIRAMMATQDHSFGKTLSQTIMRLANNLANELDSSEESDTNNEADEDFEIVGMDIEHDEASNAEADEEDDDSLWYEDADIDDDAGFAFDSQHGHSVGCDRDQKALLLRAARDLRKARIAGYKIGILRGMAPGSGRNMICLSIRVHQLALSEEAMQAWDIEASDYIVLLMRYSGSYLPYEKLIELPASSVEIEYRVGKCTRYKPSAAQASAAFANPRRANQETGDPTETNADHDDAEHEFKRLFISNSLDQFMQESFTSLVKLRDCHKISWDEANERLIPVVGLGLDKTPNLAKPRNAAQSGPAYSPKADTQHMAEVLNADHLTESGDPSLPLIATQFALRYFVRCTEFCLRCHRKLDGSFEALRPYVCSNPLCLYQYMALGFGPNIEHEILTEPLVVDLLVSFCYSSIQDEIHHYTSSSQSCYQPKFAIRQFPVGLRLQVPDLMNAITTPKTNPIKAKLLAGNFTLLVDRNEDFPRLYKNGWIAILPDREASAQPDQVRAGYPGGAAVPTTRPLAMHARIKAMDYDRGLVDIDCVSFSATTGIMLTRNNVSAGIDNDHQSDQFGLLSRTLGSSQAAEIYPYEIDFDWLDDRRKGRAMIDILDTLPSVQNMREHILEDPHNGLKSMKSISPTALSLLRWIVSSNRSCIFQVSEHTDTTATSTRGDAPLGKSREQEMVPGMEGWVQFRFAQGAPDKEMRFIRELAEVMGRKQNFRYPTIFAWHGSSLPNWHSIVRNGLDYTDTRNGRAYGHGVYFSSDFKTSQAYSHAGAMPWPNSALSILTALSLNEIINAPDEFVSSNPHYVVAQPDWHQCRYLFVKPRPSLKRALSTQDASVRQNLGPTPPTTAAETASQSKWFVQDPKRLVSGPSTTEIQIPVAASPSARAKVQFESQRPLGQGDATGAFDSDDESTKDIEFLYSDDEGDAAPLTIEEKLSAGTVLVNGNVESEEAMPHGLLQPGETDFRPGELDVYSLPRLQPPSVGGGVALRAITKEVKKLREVQAKTPVHELGWYIDFEQMTNMFQWIVELHSFDATLPFAADMKKIGASSIVLEIRFGIDFPISPPFVRVIRPRFLPFAQGGGGHVTAGGAMCMELLTNSGWSPANSMESVIIQVRMAITNLEPQPARLSRRGTLDYNIGEAIDAYERSANMHGWKIPPGLRQSLGAT